MNDGNVRRSSFDHKLHWELLVHHKRVLGVSLQTRIPTSHAIALAFQQALLQYSIPYISRMRINAEKVHVQQASVQANSRLRVCAAAILRSTCHLLKPRKQNSPRVCFPYRERMSTVSATRKQAFAAQALRLGLNYKCK